MCPVAKRLQCVKSIDPGQMSHSGGHVHSKEEEQPFHFCEERYVPRTMPRPVKELRLCSCQNCGYYCTLPLGMELFYQHNTTHLAH